VYKEFKTFLEDYFLGKIDVGGDDRAHHNDEVLIKLKRLSIAKSSNKSGSSQHVRSQG
jgi:hypothetical protein